MSIGSVRAMGARVTAKSKYQEDVLLGDHTRVWGSWFDRQKDKWGYGCCKGLNRFELECKCTATN